MIGRNYETNLNSANTNANDAYCAMLKTSDYLHVFQSSCVTVQNNYRQIVQKIQSVCQARYL